MAKNKKFDELLIESLRDTREAVTYLNTVLEDCVQDDKESQKLLLMALRNVIEAQGGIATLAHKTGLGRESLYKTLSSKGNAKLSTLTTLINAMGLNLRIGLPSRR